MLPACSAVSIDLAFTELEHCTAADNWEEEHKMETKITADVEDLFLATSSQNFQHVEMPARRLAEH